MNPNSGVAKTLADFRLAPVPSNHQFGLADVSGATIVRLRYSGRVYKPDILVPLCGPVTQRQLEHLAQSLLGGQLKTVPAERPTSCTTRAYPPDRQQFLLLPQAGADSTASSASAAEDELSLAPSVNASVNELPATAARLRSAADAAGPSGASMTELAALAKRFQARRLELGYSQMDVCLALDRLYNCRISQGMISRFELADLSLDNMAALWPILRRWLADLEARQLGGPEAADSIVAAAANASEADAVGKLAIKKRRRRPRFPMKSAQLAQLERHFLHTPSISKADAECLSRRVGLPVPVIRTWFCNRRGRERQRATAEATTDAFQNELSAAMLAKSNS